MPFSMIPYIPPGKRQVIKKMKSNQTLFSIFAIVIAAIML